MRYINVSRDEILSAAKVAIAETRAGVDCNPVAVTTATARRVLKVARTDEKFLLGDWHIGSCGCLIGNLIGEGVNYDKLPEDLYRIGIKFDLLVSEEVGVDPCASHLTPIVLRVLED